MSIIGDVLEEMEGGGKKPQGRSEIAFPYASLDEAVEVARVIFDNGTYLSREQIEGYAKFSNVRMRLAAAKMFCLVLENEEGKLGLTNLGVSILSDLDVECRVARRHAFMNIPLYQKTYQEFRGRNLPSRPEGLENAFVSFGVVAKQKDRARLAFERSAQFAGFFDVNKDRLVEPIIVEKANTIALSEDQPKAPAAPPLVQKSKNEVWSAAALEPLIKGLLDRLPLPGEDWALNERARWLRALAVNLSMVYGPEEEREIEIKVPLRQQGLFDHDPPRPAPPQTPRKVERPLSSPVEDDDIPF